MKLPPLALPSGRPRVPAGDTFSRPGTRGQASGIHFH